MEYQKIHTCPNDCILYKNQFAKMRNCPICGVLRYKVKYVECSDDPAINNDCPAKVYWYLPIIPRFKQLFAKANDANNLTWHTYGRKKMMDCSVISLILPNGRQLISCIQILDKIQET